MPDKAYSNECSLYGMALLAYTVSSFALFALSVHRQRERPIFHFERNLAIYTDKHLVIYNMRVACALVSFGFGRCAATAQCLCYM